MRTLAAIFFSALTFVSCKETIRGNGNVTTVERSVEDFHSIEVSGFFEIELIQGSPMVEVITDENLHEHIETEVSNGELRIHTQDKNLDAKELVIRVHYDKLNSLELAGAAKITTANPIRGEVFELEVAGAAEAKLDVDVEKLELDLAGGSEVDVSGRAKTAEFEIAGAGEVNALKLQTTYCIIDISGAGEVSVSVEKSLDVDITGAGEVNYKGDPSEIRKSITGAGELKQL